MTFSKVFPKTALKASKVLIKVSIIVPAYNEERRSGTFLPKLLDFVKRKIKNCEVLIVDDVSKDKTRDKINSIIQSKDCGKFAKVIGYKKNQGKGNAVAHGVMNAKGEKIIFIDADGSIQPDQIPKMIYYLGKCDVVVADRLSRKSKVKRVLTRAIASFGFNTFVSILFQYSYRDNLCGFKGFKRKVAREIFKDLIDKRWVFDVELFYKIKKRKYSIYFLPITWKHVGDSRINLIKDPFVWIFRLLKLRVNLAKWK